MKIDKSTISIIGLGYIGLPTATLLANCGYKVFGIDKNPNVVEKLNKGEIHIVEPDLEDSFNKATSSGLLKFYCSPKIADIYIICVPTPFHKKASNDPIPDLSYVYEATVSIAPLIKNNDCVILESTCPVGTTKKIEKILHKNRVDVEKISLAYCPERVLPGKIMTELVTNDRIVGGINESSTKKVSAFYKTFSQGRILSSDSKTAEMCKLAENSFRDLNIAYANELSVICESYGIDIWHLIELANHHPRVDILQPGTGVGGHCIAIDPWFIIYDNEEKSPLIRTARNVNDAKTEWAFKRTLKMVNKIEKIINKKPIVACLGLSFKPNIDDLRESTAVKITRKLIESNVDVRIVEPNITSHKEFKLTSINDALRADLIVILVKHQEFLKSKEEINSCGSEILDFCGVMN